MVLAERISRGDKQAETELYLQFCLPLNTMLRSITNNRQDAEDVSQEVMRLTIEKLRSGQIRDMGRLKGYVHQIGRFQAIEFYRKRKHLVYSSDPMTSLGVHESKVNESKVQEFAVQEYRGQEFLLQQHLTKERSGLVHKILDELKNKRDRLLLRMFYIDEFSKPEICHLLELDDLHFNRVMYRAKKRFKQLWLEVIDDDETSFAF